MSDLKPKLVKTLCECGKWFYRYDYPEARTCCEECQCNKILDYIQSLYN